MTDTAVPVRLGDKLVGFLQTGQIFRKRPTEKQFERSARLSAEWGVPRIGTSFGKHILERGLSAATAQFGCEATVDFRPTFVMISNRIFVEQQNSELPVITRAKEYIQQNQAEDLSLGQVAKAVNTSTFYFCKLFKKVTGLNFTDYVSRVRIEKAKNLLLNPNLRVSEIAYEVGFQSLTHFNWVFKKIIGQSPTEYRAQMQMTA